METSHQSNKFPCDQCTYIAQNNPDLKLHVDKQHMNNKDLPPRTQKTKRISCNICEQKFNKKETYEKHMKKVHGGTQENMNIISDQNLVQTTIPFQRKLRSYKKTVSTLEPIT